ncbi:hypothetical protein HW555_008399 [Spodoptera exigua]|uniref:Uncharacterized protein n=1 Tax=Spodoptera exigua TaxID=7107 RepID=A0A835L1S0_SPOEX|nr:hypothetical protein HW555_008399 [Spodoptera exigua]
MRVLCIFLIVAVVACGAAPGPSNEEDGKIELFSGVAIEKDAAGEEKLNVKFEPGELREAARTFEEARGKIKKYTPLIAGIGVKGSGSRWSALRRSDTPRHKGSSCGQTSLRGGCSLGDPKAAERWWTQQYQWKACWFPVISTMDIPYSISSYLSLRQILKHRE